MYWFWSKTLSFEKQTEKQLKSRLQGKNVLIVGGTAGIGKALAVSLLKQGAQVSVVGRRQPDESLAKAKFIQKDLSLIRNAEALVKDVDLKNLDILVLTNGIIAAAERQLSPEGLELDMAVSYLSRYAFLKKLLKKDIQPAGKKLRVFIMGFPGKPQEISLDDFNSDKSYKFFETHMRTVVGNEALVRATTEWNPSVLAFGLNPGLIRTEIRDNYLVKGSWLSTIVEAAVGLFYQSAEAYAENVLTPLLAAPELDSQNKALFEYDGSTLPPNPFLLKPDIHERVIKESEVLVERALKAKV